jgi:hypothetical protein
MLMLLVMLHCKMADVLWLGAQGQAFLLDVDTAEAACLAWQQQQGWLKFNGWCALQMCCSKCCAGKQPLRPKNLRQAAAPTDW